MVISNFAQSFDYIFNQDTGHSGGVFSLTGEHATTGIKTTLTQARAGPGTMT